MRATLGGGVQTATEASGDGVLGRSRGNGGLSLRCGEPLRRLRGAGGASYGRTRRHPHAVSTHPAQDGVNRRRARPSAPVLAAPRARRTGCGRATPCKSATLHSMCTTVPSACSSWARMRSRKCIACGAAPARLDAAGFPLSASRCSAASRSSSSHAMAACRTSARSSARLPASTQLRPSRKKPKRGCSRSLCVRWPTCVAPSARAARLARAS